MDRETVAFRRQRRSRNAPGPDTSAPFAPDRPWNERAARVAS
jgi:hypothetical protein